MSKTTKTQKQALVPRLRFPNFHEDWASSPMSDLYAFKGNNSLSRDKMNYGGGLIRNIHYGDIHTKFAAHFSVDAESVPYINEEESHSAIRPENYCAAGDMVFADASEDMDDIGKAIEIIDSGDHPLVSGLHTILARPKKRRFALGLGAYLFACEVVRQQIQREAQGAKVLGISASRLGNIRVPYPTSKKEQQKIADCLSSLDALIAAQAEKIDALKTHKKGLMQQLFPRECETVPRLRFPEFRETVEWEEKLIEDFFDVGSSKRVLQQDWTTQGVPFFRTRELVSLRKNEPFGSEIFISEDLFQEISDKYGTPTEGDFLVSGVGTLGIAYQVQPDDRFYFKDGNVLWFKQKGGMVSTFFKYAFESDGIQNQIMGQASISTVGTYTITNAKSTKLICPAEIDEQQMIADCLLSLDALIAAQAERLDALKTHKKGLMQQLFPSPEAVGV